MTPLQREMDDVVGVLRANMGKVLERDLKLADLEDKAEGLADGAKTFQRTSKKLKRSQWWANARWTIYAVLIGIGLIAAVVCSESPATGLAPLLSDVRGVGPLPVGTLGRCIVALTLTSTSAGFVGAPCNWHVRQRVQLLTPRTASPADFPFRLLFLDIANIQLRSCDIAIDAPGPHPRCPPSWSKTT